MFGSSLVCVLCLAGWLVFGCFLVVWVLFVIDLGVSLVLVIVLLVYCGLPECRFWLFWFGIFGLLESLDICLILLLVILALIAKFVGFSGVVTGCLVGGLWRLPIYCGWLLFVG